MRLGTYWLIAVMALCTIAADLSAQVYVRGYYRKDGTYVAPHVRSSPNSSTSDNYSARGNYNPYTGKQGTVNPYPAPLYSPNPYVPPPAQGYYHAPVAQVLSVWRCVDSMGRANYLPYPRAGCAEVQLLPAPVTAARRMRVLQPQSYAGYPCTVDCSGHEAGYEWAEDKGIDDPDDCGGNSQSFNEGCEAYAEEQQAQMVEDGECNDEDEDGVCD